MQILHVTRETAGDRRFGLGRSLLPICDALRARGHNVRYLTQEDLTERSRNALQPLSRRLAAVLGVLFGESGRAVSLAWAERLNMGRLAAKLARTAGFDVVHLHDPWIAVGYRLATLRWPPGSGSRWGFTEHGFGAYANATHEEGLPATAAMLRWLRRIESALASRADWVICPTEAGRSQLARDLGQPQALPTWHAVPHARPLLQLPSRDAARSALGLPPTLPHLVAVGRINPVKRLDAIVSAAVRLARPLRLTLLAAAGDEAPLLALAANAPALELQIRLVDDVAPYLAAADIYISAARNESFGLANLEALVAGLPAVCTAVGGVPEVMGSAALLIPGAEAGLVDRLVDAMQTLLDDGGLRQRLGAAAAVRGDHWPTAQQIGARYEAIYQRRT